LFFVVLTIGFAFFTSAAFFAGAAFCAVGLLDLAGAAFFAAGLGVAFLPVILACLTATAFLAGAGFLPPVVDFDGLAALLFFVAMTFKMF
jgi:hypothetical protein